MGFNLWFEGVMNHFMSRIVFESNAVGRIVGESEQSRPEPAEHESVGAWERRSTGARERT